MPGGIDRIAGAAPLELVVGNLEAPVPFDGGGKHGQAIPGARLDVLRLERRLGGRHQDQAVEPALLVGVLRRHEVPEMDRIKAAAKKTYFHKRPTLAAPPEVGKVNPGSWPSVTEVLLPLLGGRKRLLLLGDRVLPRILHLPGLGRVELDAFPKLGRDVPLEKDRLHRAYVDAGRAIDAVVGMDHELIVQFIETRHRTHLHAIGELAARAFLVTTCAIRNSP